MKNLFLSIITISLIISCDKKTEVIPAVEPDSTGIFKDEKNVTDSTLATNTGCYFFSNGKDSAFIQIDDNLGTITGKLVYKNTDNGIKKGEIMGIAAGDTIKTDFTFSEDETVENKEIWFLKQNGNLLEGNAKNGEIISAKNVNFASERTYNKVDCKQIEKEIQ